MAKSNKVADSGVVNKKAKGKEKFVPVFDDIKSGENGDKFLIRPYICELQVKNKYDKNFDGNPDNRKVELIQHTVDLLRHGHSVFFQVQMDLLGGVVPEMVETILIETTEVVRYFILH